MRNYEIALVFDSGLDEQGTDKEVEKIKEFISSRGGQVRRVDKWGRRRLAYEIKKKRDGYYLFMSVALDSPATLPELEHMCKLNESILRFRVLREEPSPQVATDIPLPVIEETIAPVEVEAESGSAEVTPPLAGPVEKEATS